MTNFPKLSVVIPTLNEAAQLPLLLADLHRWGTPIEILVVDAGSSDYTKKITKLGGAQLLEVEQPNRGAQLHHGACNSSGKWLLFLHADSRLSPQWATLIQKLIQSPSNELFAWFFEFKVRGYGLGIRLLEIAVALRSHIRNKPYGDQGLLISKALYERAGGFKRLPLMEDLEFIERVHSQTNLKSLRIPLYTSGRRWEKSNIIIQAIKNAHLRWRWRNGESTDKLQKDYYQKK